ncbi:MAG: hypothetical protein U0Y82_06510 [Thermoleophilia bacterium]
MLVQEVRKIIRRRGMYWSFVGVCLLAVIAVHVVNVIVRATGHDGIAGRDLMSAVYGALTFAGLIMGALLGAQEGAYDVSQGTFRYLVMTGHSKLRLYLLRLPAFVIAVTLGLLPSIVLGLVSVPLVPRHGDSPALHASDFGLAVWQPLLITVVYGLIALAVGALLRSVGAAIAVALVLNLAGLQLFQLLTLISDGLKVVVLSVAIGALTGGGEISIAAGVVTVVVWVGVFLVAGAVRTVRSEY